MEIINFVLPPIGTNCYLVYDKTKNAVLIDPAYESKKITDYIKENHINLTHILLTHGHFDHIMGCEYFKKNFSAKIAIGKNEEKFLSDPNLNSSGMIGERFSFEKADILLNENDEIKSGDMIFKVIDTPGHTSGGISYLCENNLFSGDTLFYRSIGRTDLPTGNYEELKESITKKIYLLPDDTKIFSGHSEVTTVGEEKKFNPFFRG